MLGGEMIRATDLNPKNKKKPMYGACVSLSRIALAELIQLPDILEITSCRWNFKNDSLEIKMRTDKPDTLRIKHSISVGMISEGAEVPNISMDITKRIVESRKKEEE